MTGLKDVPTEGDPLNRSPSTTVTEEQQDILFYCTYREEKQAMNYSESCSERQETSSSSSSLSATVEDTILERVLKIIWSTLHNEINFGMYWKSYEAQP